MFRNKTPQPIAVSVAVGVLDEQGHSTPVTAQFEYDPTDPYAMSILFEVEPTPRRWTFARDLFFDGFYTPTGDGDVTVFPCLDGEGRATVVVSLGSSDGDAAVEINARTASRLIWGMVNLVPRGAEGPAFDVDAVVADLLRQAATKSRTPGTASSTRQR